MPTAPPQQQQQQDDLQTVLAELRGLKGTIVGVDSKIESLDSKMTQNLAAMSAQIMAVKEVASKAAVVASDAKQTADGAAQAAAAAQAEVAKMGLALKQLMSGARLRMHKIAREVDRPARMKAARVRIVGMGRDKGDLPAGLAAEIQRRLGGRVKQVEPMGQHMLKVTLAGNISAASTKLRGELQAINPGLLCRLFYTPYELYLRDVGFLVIKTANSAPATAGLEFRMFAGRLFVKAGGEGSIEVEYPLWDHLSLNGDEVKTECTPTRMTADYIARKAAEALSRAMANATADATTGDQVPPPPPPRDEQQRQDQQQERAWQQPGHVQRRHARDASMATPHGGGRKLKGRTGPGSGSGRSGTDEEMASPPNRNSPGGDRRRSMHTGR